MLHPPEHAGATIGLGRKDLGMFRAAAAKEGVTLSMAEEMMGVFEQAIADGLGSEDWAVGQYRMAIQRSGNKYQRNR